MIKYRIDISNFEMMACDRLSWRHVIHIVSHIFEEQRRRRETEKRDCRKEQEDRNNEYQQYLVAAGDGICLECKKNVRIQNWFIQSLENAQSSTIRIEDNHARY